MRKFIDPRSRPARLRIRLQALALAFTAAATLLVAGGPPASAEPLRGDSDWVVILCKFSDKPDEPRSKAWFRDFVFGSTGSVRRYYSDVSNGLMNFRGDVVGWYKLPYTAAEGRTKGRGEKIWDCVRAAENSPTTPYTRPAGWGTKVVAVVNDDQQNAGASGAWTLLDPGVFQLDFLAHEMGHGIGLDHTVSNDGSRTCGGGPGVYDDHWDVMSAMCTFTAPGTYGPNPPGLVAHHLDSKGWLPRNRVVTFGADGVMSRTMTISAAARTTGAAPRLVRVPFDPANPFRYYTVELRMKSGWDVAIPNDTVLIHEVKDDGRAYVQRDLTRPTSDKNTDRPPLQRLSANGVTIRVNSIDAASGTASVTITSTLPEKCLSGYVWREAVAGDKVCVTPSRRTAVQDENRLSPSRTLSNGYCVSGYVWREATSTDRACVTPSSRDTVRTENATASQRKNPARLVHGPNKCKAGYVWRDADQTDYVCTTPTRRSQVAEENRLGPSRTQSNGYCVSGYVWREAFKGDRVCVTPSGRSAAADDNAKQHDRRERW